MRLRGLARTLISLCWPAILPLAGVGLWLQWQASGATPALSAAAWRVLPLIVFAAALALGVRFGRSRVVFAGAVLGVSAEALTLPFGDVLDLCAVLVAVDLALIAWLPEKGLWNVAGLLRWLVLGVQALWVVFCIEQGSPGWLSFGIQPWPAWSPLGQPAQLALALSALALLARFVRHRGPVESGLLGALVAFVLALHTAPDGRAFRAYETAAAVVLLLALVETTYTLAYRDALTGLPARRALNETLARLSGRYVLAMVDVDHFKKFNDRYGHDCGDEALRMVAARLARCGGGGRAFRYGGEEFTVLFSGKDLEHAQEQLEKLRASIAADRFTIRAATRPRKKPASPRKGRGRRRKVSVTVSVGAAGRSGRTPPEQVLEAADKCLYKAKKAGRNRVVVAG